MREREATGISTYADEIAMLGCCSSDRFFGKIETHDAARVSPQDTKESITKGFVEQVRLQQVGARFIRQPSVNQVAVHAVAVTPPQMLRGGAGPLTYDLIPIQLGVCCLGFVGWQPVVIFKHGPLSCHQCCTANLTGRTPRQGTDAPICQDTRSGSQVCGLARSVVCHHALKDLAGEKAFETADDLPFGPPFSGASFDVVEGW